MLAKAGRTRGDPPALLTSQIVAAGEMSFKIDALARQGLWRLDRSRCGWACGCCRRSAARCAAGCRAELAATAARASRERDGTGRILSRDVPDDGSHREGRRARVGTGHPGGAHDDERARA